MPYKIIIAIISMLIVLPCVAAQETKPVLRNEQSPQARRARSYFLEDNKHVLAADQVWDKNLGIYVNKNIDTKKKTSADVKQTNELAMLDLAPNPKPKKESAEENLGWFAKRRARKQAEEKAKANEARRQAALAREQRQKEIDRINTLREQRAGRLPETITETLSDEPPL
jgi:phage-related minor tail protein